ncbi:MAG: nuclear transport factor 2 family protein [Candidatus Cloacimonetes bacterium]|nr:nuclear transport factor 2 family protein [Candidatus Cloacimonadota bacterium]MCF7813923.1 nuclear transport factor 2 family protein [Candidatus Cloacimonadota bacterium]MCF7868520.1 nuclear transport factor 2 family protein [Candidatus Cloacimonadota bacterium]MCF7884035.1 nuclear transport factor 2 family protein [Candidatus Cloacimonadota bacterium]
MTRNQINNRIEAYATAVREHNSEAVSQLFAPQIDHIVHGLGTDPDNPWNSKRETDRVGIKKIYDTFFAQAEEMTVQYTDRIIDIEANSAALIVRVKTASATMQNALHIKWNTAGKIVYFYNWYGVPPA